MAFLLDAANLTAIWLEALVYGLYLVLFFYTCYVFCHPRPHSKRDASSWILLVACFTLFLLSTTHAALGLKSLFEAFISRKSNVGGGSAYFADESVVVNVARKAVFATNVMVADSLMIYRCYVLWHRDIFVIIFPIVTLCLSMIATGFVAQQLIGVPPSSAAIYAPPADPWVPVYFGISFATNLYVSIFIALRLWRASRKAGQEMLCFQKKFSTIVVVESNGLYPFVTILAVICWLGKSNSEVILVNILGQFISITPTLMILQVQMGLYSTQSDFGLPNSQSLKNKSASMQFTGFTEPYPFIPEPRSPGEHFPSLFRTTSMKTFKNRFSEGGVAYTKYGGTMGLPPVASLMPTLRLSTVSGKVLTGN